ncbi:hypothetical protein ORJ04_20560 [Rheinheimera baltica]|uniref:Uncharacterized protein n=1 Tax=Rheinheimera baltica TaxID=67576 RepID=A0ABT9I5Q4_9GAMM|nr:hypothetical protein [Rheinheimera baltica]MDP5138345.1 hypothetical protein [Rheinheimera baltica]
MSQKTLIGLTLGILALNVQAKEDAPYIWWGHSYLSMSVESCLQRAHLAIETSGFRSNPINDKYDFIYAYKGSVRIGIQCLENMKGSFFYLSVAGPENGELEKYRNELVGKIK